jgi:hypothetical protein
LPPLRLQWTARVPTTPPLLQSQLHRSRRYLPVYRPSTEEQTDPDLFSLNVKKMMVQKGNLNDSEFTYSDKLLYEQAVGYESAEVKKRKRIEARKASGRTRTRKPTQVSKKVSVHPGDNDVEGGGAGGEEEEMEVVDIEDEDFHEEEDEKGHSVGHLSRTVGIMVSS